MSLSLTVFSQTDTKISTTNKDSIVPLPKLVAREVVKDVLRKDSCEAEITIIKDNNDKLQAINNYKDKIIASKDSIIGLHIHREVNDSLIILNKDIQKSNLEVLSKDLGNQLKSQKRKATRTEIILAGAAAILGYLLITK